MKKTIFQFFGAMGVASLSTAGIAQPQLPANVQPPSGLAKPQPAQTSSVGSFTPAVAHRPDIVQAPVGLATPTEQSSSIIERKNQNSEVSTSIFTNTSAQVVVQTLRSINENLDTASSPATSIDPKNIPSAKPEQNSVDKDPELRNQSAN